jgi:predicted nucleic acid-binding protein
MKYVIEPDIIIAGLRSKAAPEHQLLRHLAAGKFRLLLSAPLLYAYEQALYDHRLELGLKFRAIEETLSFFAASADYVPCHPLWHAVMNKPEKDLSIACAYVGRADMVIVARPDLYKQANETLNLNVLNAKKALKQIAAPKKVKAKKRKAA